MGWVGGIVPGKGRRADPRHERGAALVEAAFVMSLLIMLLLGITTAGIAYGQANALQTAAREGTRFGATLPSVETNLQTVLDVTKAAATGALDDGAPGRTICVAIVGPASSSLTQDEAGVLTTGGGSCFSDGRPTDEERVQVLVSREATINAALFSTEVTLDAQSAAKYER